MAGDASYKFIGDASGLLLADMRQDMRNELATRVDKGKKSVQDIGRKALQRIKRAAEIEADMLKECTQNAVAIAVEKEVARLMKKRRLLPVDTCCDALVHAPTPAAPQSLQASAGDSNSSAGSPEVRRRLSPLSLGVV